MRLGICLEIPAIQQIVCSFSDISDICSPDLQPEEANDHTPEQVPVAFNLAAFVETLLLLGLSWLQCEAYSLDGHQLGSSLRKVFFFSLVLSHDFDRLSPW